MNTSTWYVSWLAMAPCCAPAPIPGGDLRPVRLVQLDADCPNGWLRTHLAPGAGRVRRAAAVDATPFDVRRPCLGIVDVQGEVLAAVDLRIGDGEKVYLVRAGLSQAPSKPKSGRVPTTSKPRTSV